MTSRIAVVLLAVTISLQVVILYRQQNTPTLPQPEPIQDVPEGTVLDTRGMPTMGRADAGVILIEFADYECPFCRRHAIGVMRALKDKFITTGKIQYAFANYPLRIHPNARFLARAALCAGERGRYWEMHDSLFESEVTTRADVLSLLSDIPLDPGEFGLCLDSSPGADTRIDLDMKEAEKLRLNSTPSFAIGLKSAPGDESVLVDTIIIGAQPMNVFERVIDKML
jgi:protein-disulfide isomerase